MQVGLQNKATEPQLGARMQVEHVRELLGLSFCKFSAWLAPTYSQDNSPRTGLTSVCDYLLQSLIHCNITSVVKVRDEHVR